MGDTAPGRGEGEAELATVPLAIELGEERLRFPGLMDQQAVDDLERKGFGISPAFRVRRGRVVRFDVSLTGGEGLAWSGDLVAHTWWVAAPADLPRLQFGHGEDGLHQCALTWTEPHPFGSGADPRHHRYVELHHLGKGPPVPLAVFHKPAPRGTDLPGGRPGPSPQPASGAAAKLSISFRELADGIRPWFDIFHPDPFAPGIEPEPVLEALARSYILELELTQGEFVPAEGATPHIRWYDAYGQLPDRPEHVGSVEIEGGSRLVVSWSNPGRQDVTSFDVLCRYRGRDLWLDPTIYTKGIG